MGEVKGTDPEITQGGESCEGGLLNICGWEYSTPRKRRTARCCGVVGRLSHPGCQRRFPGKDGRGRGGYGRGGGVEGRRLEAGVSRQRACIAQVQNVQTAESAA